MSDTLNSNGPVLIPLPNLTVETPPLSAPPLYSSDAERNEAIDTLARTIWGESRGEPLRGQEAVASVILNRVAVAQAHGGKFWWGGDVISVCRKPWQFSAWNANDPNLPRLLAVTADNPVFAVCQRIARRAVSGTLADPTGGPTGGATHYHAAGTEPNWARGKTPLIEIGHHLFYRLED